MVKDHVPRAAARDLAGCQQRLAFGFRATGRRRCARRGIELPSVVARVPADDDTVHKLPLDAVYELPRFPRMATV